ncbi:methyltransferase domain-containing protein [Paenibacillus polymyxa]|uniref:RNA methyltransferase n=1 Tax=Paenibacillus polymyxa (strain SC2) TaxID=886882 RepID=E3EGT7_PAEPS|nr:methyltransferase domain-containing protein [Paenibacillus polymyxa]ADO55171.1 RNA methyltransferase [Paenibacillus polymyxa SC2]WPQ57986.1 RNA methyltransferase [Paenibacillus polymyxa]CCC84020.1 putative methyltransferase [Paenibacillus polymyxa M1]
MNKHKINTDEMKPSYIYTYACHETERELCLLELKCLFGQQPVHSSMLLSHLRLEPGTSPFIHLRLDIVTDADTLEELCEAASRLQLEEGKTFKVLCLKEGDNEADYDERRGIERRIGARIQGQAQMKTPDVILGVIRVGERWLMGICEYSDRSWQERRQKPQNYSTGLPVLVARALVNLAANDQFASKGKSDSLKLLDPCCGMGNVMIEALSMDKNIRGCDINPLAVRGARVNLRHYGYEEDLVKLGDMNMLAGTYDAAILDMPYNLCSVLPAEEQKKMLRSLRRLAARAVIVSTEPMATLLSESGWTITEQCRIYKTGMSREIWICK